MASNSSPVPFEDKETGSDISNNDDVTITSGNGSGSASCHSSDSWSNNEASSSETTQSLPPTVTVLDGLEGSKVFLVGTAHFSEESNRDVQTTIRKVQPSIVVLELCSSRLAILSLDEKTLLEESSHLSLEKIRQNIGEQGLVQGVMYTLLLSLSAHLTRELGMAPGGEFRTAFKEATKIPGCKVQLGDRPVHVTLKRAISSLSFWQKTRLASSILFSKESISKEEVEKCKDKDLLTKMLTEITGEYPSLSQVLVHERDTYLTYSLQLASAASIKNGKKVVGVVGIGHVPGIVEKWGKVTDEDISPIVGLPKESMVSFLLCKSLKYSVRGLLLFSVYRFLLPNSIKSVLRSGFSSTFNQFKDVIVMIKN